MNIKPDNQKMDTTTNQLYYTAAAAKIKSTIQKQ